MAPCCFVRCACLNRFVQVVVPEAYSSTHSVLIMEYVPGKMLVDALQEHAENVARERGMTVDQLRSDFLFILVHVSITVKSSIHF